MKDSVIGENDLDFEKSALLIIDMQPDFMPGGALEVDGGDRILSGVKRLMCLKSFSVKVATQDWHPPEHVSFAANHKGREPFETIMCNSHEQMLWPAHCVQGTPGARLHGDLPWDEVDLILRKGRIADADSYSGFRNNYNRRGKRPSTGLCGYLKEREIKKIFLCGLARDVCVLWTALDGAEAGFEVYFVWDLTRAVNPEKDDHTTKVLTDHRVKIIQQETLCR